MGTSGSIIVSGSWFLPGTTIATGSIAAITASLISLAFKTKIVSGSQYTGSFYLSSGSLGASGSVAAVTGSQYVVGGINTILVNFQSSTGSITTGSGGVFQAILYVMSGYYASGATRETWSGNSVNTPNPTGHSLIDITVMGSYPPQNSAT